MSPPPTNTPPNLLTVTQHFISCALKTLFSPQIHLAPHIKSNACRGADQRAERRLWLEHWSSLWWIDKGSLQREAGELLVFWRRRSVASNKGTAKGSFFLFLDNKTIQNDFPPLQHLSVEAGGGYKQGLEVGVLSTGFPTSQVTFIVFFMTKLDSLGHSIFQPKRK